MKESYLHDLKEHIADTPEELFQRSGYEKAHILKDEGIMERLWAIYQKAVEEYEMEPACAYHDALQDVLEVSWESQNLTEQAPAPEQPGFVIGGFQKVLDTFVRDKNGNMTNARFVRLDGRGFRVCIVFGETDYVDVSVRLGNESEYRHLYGYHAASITVEYDDLTPARAVLHLSHMRMNTMQARVFAVVLNRFTQTLKDVELILKNLDVIRASASAPMAG